MVPPWLRRIGGASVRVQALFVMLCFCVNYGCAIKCFVCDSTDNPSCAELNTNSSIVPEECTLEKMKSLNTWLFELNKFSYYDTGVNKSPIMNCQKVIAKNPNTQRMVTARFCQLDTGDSDACSILRGKLNIPDDDIYVKHKNHNKNQHQKKGKQQNEKVTDEEERFHCSVCTTDRCNDSTQLKGRLSLISGMSLALGFLYFATPLFKYKICYF